MRKGETTEKTESRVAESKAILLLKSRVSIALVGIVAESIILPQESRPELVERGGGRNSMAKKRVWQPHGEENAPLAQFLQLAEINFSFPVSYILDHNKIVA